MGNETEEKTLTTDLSEARKNAWSFPGLTPPPGAKEIGREKRGADEVIYYSDGKGNYWFNTKSQIALEKELRSAEKRRKRRAFSGR